MRVLIADTDVADLTLAAGPAGPGRPPLAVGRAAARARIELPS